MRGHGLREQLLEGPAREGVGVALAHEAPHVVEAEHQAVKLEGEQTLLRVFLGISLHIT